MKRAKMQATEWRGLFVIIYLTKKLYPEYVNNSYKLMKQMQQYNTHRHGSKDVISIL